jgi:hypothetical protein
MMADCFRIQRENDRILKHKKGTAMPVLQLCSKVENLLFLFFLSNFKIVAYILDFDCKY